MCKGSMHEQRTYACAKDLCLGMCKGPMHVHGAWCMGMAFLAEEPAHKVAVPLGPLQPLLRLARREVVQPRPRRRGRGRCAVVVAHAIVDEPPEWRRG